METTTRRRSSADSPGGRLELALDLAQSGIEMMREHLHREHPGATEEEIDHRLRAWLRQRPGAVAGDGPQPEAGKAA